MLPALKVCPFLGPAIGEESPNRPLPANYATDPFQYLPPRITLSAEELDLANRYQQGDFSGGYITSQIARFRHGSSPEAHRQRRERFQRIKTDVDRRGLVLPPAYIELVESDDYVSRLRHNNIWLRIPDELAPLPAAPDHWLYLIFYESQGCDYWHLLLSPEGGHIVTYSAHPFGVRYDVTVDAVEDLAPVEVYHCANSFTDWIVNYFAECIETDRRYEQLLREFPGR